MSAAVGVTSSGVLAGLRVVEFAGLGPGPYAAMLLADMGADVVTIVRPGQWRSDARQYVNRGRRVVELDLKKPDDVARALNLLDHAEALIEGFRPLVMERLGLGPDVTLKRNPRLVYGRMTGWGQEGPLSQVAGHDINYIAIAGALDAFRSAQGEPVAPLNLVGDYGGGGLFLVVGLLAAVLNARASGKGQVVDAAMCDGVVHMLSMFHGLEAGGRWSAEPRTNLLDGGAPFYRTYACKDGGFVAVGALEPQFFAELRRIAGLDGAEFEAQYDRKTWPAMQRRLADVFLTKSRDEWASMFEGHDACVTPVLGLFEAPLNSHLRARETLIENAGKFEPAPAPRFSATPSSIPHSAAVEPEDIEAIARGWSQPQALARL